MNKELIFIKGFAKGKEYWKLMEAIHIAISLHEGQKRINGEEYIDHPTRVTSFLISIGITDQQTLVDGMLHDVIEDCHLTRRDLILKYKIEDGSALDIEALSKTPKLSKEKYYQNIIERGVRAMLVKIADRFHNISTMAGAFSLEKMLEYVEETENYVLPMCSIIKKKYPEFSDQAYAMKYMIESFNRTIKFLIGQN